MPATEPTVQKRGPIEQWLFEHGTRDTDFDFKIDERLDAQTNPPTATKVCVIPQSELIDFARQQDRIRQQLVDALKQLDACIEDFFLWKRTHGTARLSRATVKGWQDHIQAALKAAEETR